MVKVVTPSSSGSPAARGSAGCHEVFTSPSNMADSGRPSASPTGEVAVRPVTSSRPRKSVSTFVMVTVYSVVRSPLSTRTVSALSPSSRSMETRSCASGSGALPLTVAEAPSSVVIG